MRTSTAIALFMLAALAAPAAAQSRGTVMTLTADDAVKLALEHNVDLAADRLSPQISDAQVALASSAFRPVLGTNVQRNNQLQPPTSFLIPTSTRTDVITSSLSVSQRLSKFGTSYSIGWDNSHTDSNSFLNSYNPILRSGLSINFSQPLLRDYSIDGARLQKQVSLRNRDISSVRLRESTVQTVASTKAAYWNLYAANANVEARRTALTLSEELARVNKAKVDVGQSPPLDLASAQAEVASNLEQLIVAETLVRQAEDRLRMLILDPTVRANWDLALTPTDLPPDAAVSVDINAAVTNALTNRTDLIRSRMDIENSETSLKYTNNQRLPDVRLNAGYQSSGLGGTEVLRSGGFPGTVVGAGQATAYGSVLDQLFKSQYPTWTLGLSVSYPLGQSGEEATYAKSLVEHAQAKERIKSTEARVIQQVREAGWKIEMNAKRIDAARTARILAEQRLDAEQKRFDVGLSTNFLVIQAQRDLAQAKTNELSAVLAYDLALVEFDAIQQAPTQSAQSSATTGASSSATTTSAASAVRRAVGATTTSATTGSVFP